MIFAPDSLIRTILTALAAAAGLLEEYEVHLYQGELTLSRLTTLAELEAAEADFTGYAHVEGTDMVGPFTDPDGRSKLMGALATFLASATPAGGSQTVGGYFVTNNGSTVLFWAEALPTPVVLTAAGQGVAVVPEFGLQLLPEASFGGL